MRTGDSLEYSASDSNLSKAFLPFTQIEPASKQETSRLQTNMTIIQDISSTSSWRPIFDNDTTTNNAVSLNNPFFSTCMVHHHSSDMTAFSSCDSHLILLNRVCSLKGKKRRKNRIAQIRHIEEQQTPKNNYHHFTNDDDNVIFSNEEEQKWIESTVSFLYSRACNHHNVHYSSNSSSSSSISSTELVLANSYNNNDKNNASMHVPYDYYRSTQCDSRKQLRQRVMKWVARHYQYSKKCPRPVFQCNRDDVNNERRDDRKALVPIMFQRQYNIGVSVDRLMRLFTNIDLNDERFFEEVD